MLTIKDVQDKLANKLMTGDLVVTKYQAEKRSSETVEIAGDSFIADSGSIFGTPNQDYIERELAWYRSLSLNVNDIPAPIPEIWVKIADQAGFINSNYGWCIFSNENVEQTSQLESKMMPVGDATVVKCQYNYTIAELLRDPNSRRAMMIYIRPSMHADASKNGRSDFMCTTSAQLLIRGGKLVYIVNMRSNDVVMGYKNDWAWHKSVHLMALTSLNNHGMKLEVGDLIWHANSLHVYDKQFYLLDHYNKTGEYTITKARYRELYPTSPYN